MRHLYLYALSALLLSGIAVAEEVAPNTTLSAANIDTLSQKTLDGTPIKDLLTKGQELMIRQFNWTMNLHKATPIEHNPKLVATTEKFKGQARVNPETRLLENHTGGIPFPEIDPKDPQAGIKVAYNFMRGPWFSDTLALDPMLILSIDGKRGLQRQMGMRFARLQLVGRISEPYTLGDGTVAKYETGAFRFPNDLKGIGTVTVQYTDGRLPDVYAYLKMVRRVRRLSSSAWADPISATDILVDEQFGMNADPVWYQSFKLLSKRKILAVVHSLSNGANEKANDPQQRYPLVRMNEAPYWNFNEAWEPRDVWEVEAIPPKTHLVSKKVQYYDADPYMGGLPWQDYYDRGGKFWRIENCNYKVKKGDDGNPANFVTIIIVADVQREHATLLYDSSGYQAHIQNPNVADYAPESLERIAGQ